MSSKREDAALVLPLLCHHHYGSWALFECVHQHRQPLSRNLTHQANHTIILSQMKLWSMSCKPPLNLLKTLPSDILFMTTLPTLECLSPDPSQTNSHPSPPNKPGGALTTKEPRFDERSLLTPPITPETKPALPPQPVVPCSYDSLWPDWARPEEDLPIATAKDLHDRAVRLRETQSKAEASHSYAVQGRSWSKTLQLLPQDSAVWVTLVRSRWLVIETIKGNLELWDIEGPAKDKPVATFHALHGSVDGFYVFNGPKGAVELSISTTSFHVYTFDLDLPHHCESRLGAAALDPKDTLLGWAGLKDKMNGTWAFAKHRGTSNQGFLYRCGAHLPSVRLACATDVEENQNVLDILLRPNVIAVARNRSIDLYNPSKLETQIDTQAGEPLPYLTFDQSLPSPESEFIHHGRLLRRNPAGLKMEDDGSIAYAVYLEQGWLVSEIRCDLDRDHFGSSPKYDMFQAREVATAGGTTLALSWGESGSRMVLINDWQLDMRFAARRSPPDGSTDRKDGPDVNFCRTLAIWRMPLELGDIPRCIAFDEATGIVVVGMASGKLLVADAGEMVLPSPLPQSDLDQDDHDFDSPYMRLKQAQSSPHPSSKEWLGLARNPGMHKPRKIKSPDLATEGAPGWTRDVESYYPFANHPSYYLSIPWVIRDLAGIPFDARCIMVSSKKIDSIKGKNAAIIEVEVEFGIGGKLLLMLWDEDLDWDLFKFRSLITSDNIVEYLKNGAAVATLCDPHPLLMDPVTSGQWAIWEVRREAVRRMNRIM
ncbi:hypothetical protein M407DRAFT_32141 [Tulasnella calospora MUT 4182]|uniref:Uncharacterized protein n=1 Tax=Tulasnella calospora MUT 4182 TaxID=1051891 RepID=A0A0C3PTT5_9AGAM|nr:hypothetical protein M407DRAFT_32141 [Tulasnella calospora MUT 4182]